jgi:hypothetical protein
MIDLKNLLEIQYYDASAGTKFTDYKLSLGNPAGDTATIALDIGDYIYLGYHKPIQSFYVDMTTPNSLSNVFTLEYYNGTTWVALVAIDSTKKLTRSEFIQFEQPSAWDNNLVNSIDKYWLRISSSALTGSMVFNFIGLVFATDEDLKLEYPRILNAKFLGGETNFLKTHIATRDDIIQDLTNKGVLKLASSGLYENIVPWDLLSRKEVNKAAIYLALSKIYNNISDSADDIWHQKALYYRSEYNRYFSQINLTIDILDSGVVSSTNNKTTTNIKMRY